MPCYDWSLESKEGKNKHQINRFDAVSILVETKISFRWLSMVYQCQRASQMAKHVGLCPSIRMLNTSFISQKLNWKMVAGTSKFPTSISRIANGSIGTAITLDLKGKGEKSTQKSPNHKKKLVPTFTTVP